jgi:hypothetical protein
LQATSISLNRTPTGVETPDVIDLRKTQRKEPEKPLYHVSLGLLHRHLTCRSKARKQQVFPLHVYFSCCGLLIPQEFDVGCRFWRRRRNAFSQGPLWVQVTCNIPAHLTFPCKVSVKDALSPSFSDIRNKKWFLVLLIKGVLLSVSNTVCITSPDLGCFLNIQVCSSHR